MSAARWFDRHGIEWRLEPLGRHLRLHPTLADPIERARCLAAVRQSAWALRPPAARDLVPGERALTIELAAPTRASAWLAAATDAADPIGQARHVDIPVAYDAQGDETALTERLALPWREIAARHANATYRVAYLGFTPGFAYLLGTPASLALPRRPSPQPMRSGTVAIAAGRTGIYPSDGPGGWWRIGWTPAALFDPHAPAPTLLLPGDQVRFVPTSPAAASERRVAEAGGPRRSREGDVALSVQSIWPGGASLQGRPRPGVAHLGMAEAGALDPEAFHRASRLAGAPLRHPAIEFAVPHATLRAERDLIAAVAGGAMLTLAGRALDVERAFAWPRGATLDIRPDPRRPGAPALLAVGGGLKPLGGAVGHPTLLRGGSTDARAGVGGFGRALQAGDVLERAGMPLTPAPWVAGARRWGGPLRLHPGPAGTPGTAALLAGRFRLERRDRMGARLSGGRRPDGLAEGESEGVPIGAVQWPPDGNPIVLLADRGRTGGYPLVGLIDPLDLPRLARARPGAIVRFTPIRASGVG